MVRDYTEAKDVNDSVARVDSHSFQTVVFLLAARLAYIKYPKLPIALLRLRQDVP